MYAAGLVLLAVLFSFAGAYAEATRRRALRSVALLDAAVRRESDVLEAARVLTAASRDSMRAVLTALDRTVRILAPPVDAVLIFVPEGEDLRCEYAGGPRAEGYAGVRIRRDHPTALPSRAALCGHRVDLSGDARPLIPTDRAALAVPMLAGDEIAAVVYLAGLGERIGDAELLVRTIGQAAAPYALAVEREADRASATYDALTGLYTPRAFRRRLQDDVATARAGARAVLSLWFVDTDHFKRVNDALGHAAGDVVLQQMAALLRSHTVAGVDLAARNGGDEFCAIVRDAHKVLSIERAQRLCEAVRAFDFGVNLPITASIGVAAFPYDAGSANELLEVADAAMYHSKRAGRDRVSFASGAASFAVYR